MLPHRLGRDVNIGEVRAVADLARAEEWDDIFSVVLERLQDKTPRESVSNKLAIVSPYLALIGLVSVVSAAVAFRRRKV